MSFQTGDHVVLAVGDMGVGRIVEDCGLLGGEQTYRVAWPGPEGAISQVLKTPEKALKAWRPDPDSEAL